MVSVPLISKYLERVCLTTIGRRLVCVTGDLFWLNEMRIGASRRETSTEYRPHTNPAVSTSLRGVMVGQVAEIENLLLHISAEMIKRSNSEEILYR